MHIPSKKHKMNKAMIHGALAVFLLIAQIAYGQNERETIRTSARQVVLSESASKEIQNLYPAPKESIVMFGGRKEIRQLNYNLLLDFFYSSGDRGSITWFGPDDVDSVRIGETLFASFRDEGFFQPVPEAPGLLIKHRLDVSTETLAKGAYGTTDETASIEVLRGLTTATEGLGTSHTAYLENPGGQELRITLKREQRFYLLKDGKPNDASNRRALQRAYPGYRREIRRFVRQHNIDFESKADMIKVLHFIHSLEE